MAAMPITRVVLYKHGVGYFEREGTARGDESIALAFKQAEVSDVLKSLIVLDLDGGHIASVSYDSTKPIEQLLAEVSLSIPEDKGLTGLLPQLKGARVRITQAGAEPIEGMILGLDSSRKKVSETVIVVPVLSLLVDDGAIRSFELPDLTAIQILDEAVRADLDYYLKTQLSAKKKDARTFSIFARGEGERRIRLAYNVAAPVWKATYRLMLGGPEQPPQIQGWAVVDNTQDEDWENISLSLVSGLPVSFIHDLYTPRYIRRPTVEVRETTGVLPPEVESGMEMFDLGLAASMPEYDAGAAERGTRSGSRNRYAASRDHLVAIATPPFSSAPAQVRERKLGDLFAYEIEHPVTIRRNQAALVPIVLREFKGRPVLLYNKETRAQNPLRCVEFENTTGLTLEGGPVTVQEDGSYVGEAMLETIKPDETRLIPFAVELGVKVLDNVASQDEHISRVVIHNGTLQTRHAQVKTTTYAFDNKGEGPAVVYLEHRREDADWKLVEPGTAHEITESFWRFRFELAPRGQTHFRVRTQRLVSQRHVLGDTSARQLELWIDQLFLDDSTAEIIRQALLFRQQLSEVEEQVKRMEAERKTIHAEQSRIRENLKSLGDRASEKELKERFVRTFTTQEDRLEDIDKQLAASTAAIDNLRSLVGSLLSRLNYQADLQSSSPAATTLKRKKRGGEEGSRP